MDDESKEQIADQHLRMAQVAAKSLGESGRERADQVGRFLVSGKGTHAEKLKKNQESATTAEIS